MADPATYLDGLKARLGITAGQQAAWDAYAAVVRGHAEQMRESRRTMFEAMQTATWEERRDMMHRAFQEREQTRDAVHNAAMALLPDLTAAQKTQAERILPGLAPPAMMGRGRM